ncbi:MAG: leucyl aminopeptidase [Clostridia bacterium]|nr:leucyl aminopeptidase [Clostridia bacterium]
MTEIRRVDANPLEVEADALVVGVYSDGDRLDASARAVDRATGGLVERWLAEGRMRGRLEETAVLPAAGGLRAPLLVLAGLGRHADLDGLALRRAAARAARAARGAGARRLASTLYGAFLGDDEAAGALVEGTLLGLDRFLAYKGREDEEAPRGEEPEIFLLLAEAAREEAVRRAEVLARATLLARQLANEPANQLPPRRMAERAQAVAADAGLEFTALDEVEMERLGMGALLGVNRGSHEPPRLIVLRYRSGRPEAPLLALVGKGIVFDSGGISLKPAAGMHEMKMDKSGAADVIGAMQAIAALKPPLDVIGVAPVTENMPGGGAQRPGDVVRAMNGTTIEVLNTDAEGRLVLADAVAYAAGQGARWIVTVATLTGAVVTALGHEAAAILGNDRRLIETVLEAGRASGERYWELPSWREYRRLYASDVADLANVAPRDAGAGTIVGGLFIGEFVGEAAWAHLDVAGTAWVEKPEALTEAGATGFATRTLALLPERLAAQI